MTAIAPRLRGERRLGLRGLPRGRRPRAGTPRWPCWPRPKWPGGPARNRRRGARRATFARSHGRRRGGRRRPRRRGRAGGALPGHGHRRDRRRRPRVDAGRADPAHLGSPAASGRALQLVGAAAILAGVALVSRSRARPAPGRGRRRIRAAGGARLRPLLRVHRRGRRAAHRGRCSSARRRVDPVAARRGSAAAVLRASPPAPAPCSCRGLRRGRERALRVAANRGLERRLRRRPRSTRSSPCSSRRRSSASDRAVEAGIARLSRRRLRRAARSWPADDVDADAPQGSKPAELVAGSAPTEVAVNRGSTARRGSVADAVDPHPSWTRARDPRRPAVRRPRPGSTPSRPGASSWPDQLSDALPSPLEGRAFAFGIGTRRSRRPVLTAVTERLPPGAPEGPTSS